MRSLSVWLALFLASVLPANTVAGLYNDIKFALYQPCSWVLQSDKVQRTSISTLLIYWYNTVLQQ